jgi:hypothetical protein
MLGGAIRNRGKTYWQQGRVSQLDYDAATGILSARVEGTRSYEVTLEWQGKGWLGNCTCPMQICCKHSAATLYAALSPLPVAEALSPSSNAAPPQTKPQGFAALFQERLGRNLSRQEQSAAKCVDDLFFGQNSGRVPEHYFRSLRCDRSNAFWNQHYYQIWPRRPSHVWEAWLHIAALARQMKWTLLPGLIEITPWEEVDAFIAEAERRRNLEIWRGRIDSATLDLESFPEDTSELRVRLNSNGLQLEWRKPGRPQFKEFKRSDFNSYLYSDRLPFDPLSCSIWKLFAGNSFSGPSRDSGTGGANQILRVLLQLPMYESRLVNPLGNAFRRVEEPLRWRVDCPDSEKGDYRLALVLPDGSLPPPALVASEGTPSFYVTPEVIYTAPQFGGLPITAGPAAIPAEVVESNAGLRLLDRLQLPTPSRMAERVRTVRLQLIVRCWMGEESGVETLNVSLWAESAPKVVHAQFDVGGWIRSGSAHPASLGNSSGSESFQSETLTRLEDSVMKQAGRVVEILEVTWNSYDRCWTRRALKRFPEQFAQALAQLPADPGITLELDPVLASLRERPVSARFSLEAQEFETDWFDLRVQLSVSDTTLTPEEIKLLLAAKGGFVRLGAKGWRRLSFEVDPEQEQELADIGLSARDISAESHRLHALQLAGKKATRQMLPEAQSASIERRAEEIRTRVTPEVASGLKATLRPYQIEGYHFLAYLAENRFGGILADDMGLGKTVQTLAWLLWLRARPDFSRHPSLVVCPKSVTENWVLETARFAPELRAHVLPRGGCDAAELERLRREHDLLVINYAQLRLIESLCQNPWQAVILDEAQYIKNPQSQTAQSATQLRAAHRIALSGTPIENRLLDLWSILHFAMPGILGNRAAFTRNFDQKNDPLARRRLAARVRPFLLRRTKKEVAKDLPERIEEDIHCELEGEQSKLYTAELKRARAALLKIKTNKELDKARFSILTSLLRLRQICCHPALVQAKAVKSESAKLNALVDLLEPLVEEGQKVLIFSQFVEMLGLIRDEIRRRDWRHLLLTGDTENRGDLVREFQETEGASLFLISLRAGGFGLNLTAASYVILFDPWWNPAVENQAIDRTHRIGQTQTVNAYRLIMKGSIEEKIRGLQTAKSALAEDILGEESFTRSLTLDDFRFLLES